MFESGMSVRVRYEDDTVREAPLSDWPTLRADGVQAVTIVCGRCRTVFQAASVYWLYPEGETFVVGCGSVRYDPNPLNEVIIAPDGSQTERTVEFMPDLRHDQIKLGWWKRG